MKPTKQIWIFAAILLFLLYMGGEALASTTFAQEGPTLNRKVRNLGMGNIGVALYGTGDSSPFYNPAGLNDVEKGRFQFFTHTLDVAGSTIGLITDMKDLVKEVDDAATDAEKIRVYNNFLQEHTGEFQHFRYTFDIFNYARKNFAVGLLMDEKLDMSFRDQSFPHFDVQNLGDIGVYVSGARDFRDKIIQVGFTVRPIVRLSLDEADQTITSADVLGKDAEGKTLLKSQMEKAYKEKRFGLGVDLGLKSNLAFEGLKKMKIYEQLKPEVGITWQDIGSPSFGAAPDNEQSISVGMAVHPAIWKLKNTIGLDLREINQERGFLSKLHFGLESKLPWLLTLRGGMSQGYLTGGATLDVWIVKLDAAIYFEEVGIKTREKGNLRWATTLSFNI